MNGRKVFEEDSHELEQKDLAFKERVIAPILTYVRRITFGKMSKSKMENLDKKLLAAGHPFRLTAVDFKLIQISLSVIVFIVSFFLFNSKTEETLKVFMMSSVFSIFVYLYFNFYLNAKKKARIKEIEKSMSDFFDMITVSIEAGMGLDGALKKVCKQMHSPLSTEFLYALEDMKLGKTRRQAFIELRERVPSEFFRSIMNSIIQADQLGIGMTKVLQAQTQRIRENQRQVAKEQAMKAPVKMLMPMVIFIFPTLFIVLLGPVVVNLVTKWL
ncbi:type II secretion system F family protein [Bacillus sp. JJ1533]|uniref:type II secretion system F family protein n=1 Tax=Bacillus sp. JJ1533 TaxID=3122959 RepID=UPI002FFE9F04